MNYFLVNLWDHKFRIEFHHLLGQLPTKGKRGDERNDIYIYIYKHIYIYVYIYIYIYIESVEDSLRVEI